jgi:nucleoside phosphorylase
LGDGTTLIVSGVGKTAAAAAVAHLRQRLSGSSIDGWINVGIGGHRSYPLGTPILASEVRDGTSGERWSVAIPFEPPCRTDTVLTVERVERVYEEQAVYDMEASGFYEAALDGGRPGLVQVLKVVSDNNKSGVESVSGTRVEELLAAEADTIEALVSTVSRRAYQTAAAL